MNKSKKIPESGMILPPTPKNTAYFVPAISKDEKGPGILVLHSWWGLNSSIKKYCEKLSDKGYCVLAPDFFGKLPKNEDEAKELLNNADPNEMADLVLSSINALRTYTNDSKNPIAIIGFAMGGSLGLWAATKLTESVKAVVSICGTQNIDFKDSESDYLLIGSANDSIATIDEMRFSEALIGLAGAKVESEIIPGTKHGFWDENDESYNIIAKDLCELSISNYLDNHFCN